MRLAHGSTLSFTGVVLLLACGSATGPTIAAGTGTGGAMSGGSGFTAAGSTPGGVSTGASGGTPGITSTGGTPVDAGGTSPDGAQPGSTVTRPSGGSSASSPGATGGTASGGPSTGGKASGGSSTSTGGTSTGGTSTGGTSTGGSSSTNCTDAPNPEQPDTPCSTWKEWNNCGESWMVDGHICDQTCGRCDGNTTTPSGGSGNTGNTGSTGGNTQTETNISNVSNGQQGFSTRYWDCCKPTCGWAENTSRPISSCGGSNESLGGNYSAQSACAGGNAHMCWGWAPWSVSSNLAYGFAAFNGAGCGTCYQLDFSGNSNNGTNDAGSQSLAGKHMIVQIINTGGIAGGQFDLLVPGGGVGDFNACSSQWGSSDLGEQYGGFFLACQKQNNFDYESSRTCAKNWCQKVFSGKQDLLDGCNWYVEWAGMADNPSLTYGQVSCPSAITAVSGI